MIKNRIIIHSFLSFIFLMPLILYPKSIETKLEQFSTEHGLSNNIPCDIVQDGQGFLWIATRHGLCRYDGYEFKNYYHDQFYPTSLSSNRIEHLYVDRSGMLWIITDKGLHKYDQIFDRFILYMPNPSDPGNPSIHEFADIAEDISGNYWIATHSGRLYKTDREFKYFKRFRHDPNDQNSMANGRISTMIIDRDNILWIGTPNGFMGRRRIKAL